MAIFAAWISWVTAKIGDAVSANAAKSQYVRIPAIDLSGTKTVTVALWANRTYSTAGGHALFEATANYDKSTTGFGFFPDDDTCAGIQAALRGNLGYVANCYSQPSSGVWHHLAVVLDKGQTGGDAVKFYVDGALQTANRSLYASTNTNNFGNNPLYLFSRAGTTEFNSGMIHDLRIYDSALTAEQIQQVVQVASRSINGFPGGMVPAPASQVALSWTASTSPGIAGYNAYRSTSSGGPYTNLNSSLISTTSYTDQTVQSGYTYYYVTTAVDSLGLESVYSNQAAATVP